MIKVVIMRTKDTNISIFPTIPEDAIIKPKSAEEIYSELAASKACYERGEYEDFDAALDAISKRYGL